MLKYLVALVCGLAFAFLLYYRFPLPDKRKWVRYTLFICRTLAVSILVLLLFNPYFVWKQSSDHPPQIVFIQDNSASLSQTKDSINFRKEYPNQIQDFLKKLSDFGTLRYLSFGNEVKDTLSFKFDGSATNLQKAVDELKDRYAGENLGAIILATDGIINQGLNPEFTVPELGVPVYSIALGDTSDRRDVAIRQVRCNDIVFKGNAFQIQADIKFSDCKDKSSEIELLARKNGSWKKLSAQPVRFNTPSGMQSYTFSTDALDKGLQAFRLRVKPLDKEYSVENNEKEFFVEIIDTKTRILLLAQEPHPDIAAIRNALAGNENYDLQVQYENEFEGNIEQFNLIIAFHPAQTLASKQRYTLWSKKSLPIWYVLGCNSKSIYFNGTQGDLVLNDKPGSPNKVQANRNPGFGLFDIQILSPDFLKSLPPLDVPDFQYKQSPALEIALQQQIGSVPTPFPLLAFSSSNGTRKGFWFGEGLWKWRLAEYEQEQNQEKVHELIRKTVQYLILKEDKRPFRVKLDKKLFQQSDPIVFSGELYNKNIEPVNEPEVKLLITSESGQQYPFSMQKTAQAYRLDAGTLPPGRYFWKAECQFLNEKYTNAGEFTLAQSSLESQDLQANHALLNRIAKSTQAASVNRFQLDSLLNLIKARDELKPMRITETVTEEFIQLKWLILVLGILLGTEWFIRKYTGGY